MENEIEYDSNIKHQLNYHIIPFAYNLDYEEAKKCYQEKCDEKLWRTLDMGDENLLKHINNLINVDNNDSEIAHRYILEQKGRGKIGIPNSKDYKFNLKAGKNSSYKIIIDSLEVILFETQIGFVILKLIYPNQSEGEAIDIDTIININYIIKHLNISENKLEYIIKKSKNEEEARSLHFRDIINTITNDLNVKTYFENYNEIKAHSTLGYSAIVLDKALSKDFDENKQLIGTNLFRMRRVFKESYKIAENQLFIDNNIETLQLFQNIYWGASLEAVACICYEVDDEITNRFINSNYINRLENSYFFLYILILNMRYSLIYFSILSSLLPKNIDECIEVEKKKDNCIITISKLEEKISFFKLRCVFRDVSNVTHQKHLYELIWKINNINELLEELDSEIKALAIMSNLRKKQEEKEEKAKEEKAKKMQEKKENKFKDLLIIITTTFTILSLIANIGKIAESIEKVVSRTQSWIELGISVIIIIIAFIFICLYIKYLNGKKNN